MVLALCASVVVMVVVNSWTLQDVQDVSLLLLILTYIKGRLTNEFTNQKYCYSVIMRVILAIFAVVLFRNFLLLLHRIVTNDLMRTLDIFSILVDNASDSGINNAYFFLTLP